MADLLEAGSEGEREGNVGMRNIKYVLVFVISGSVYYCLTGFLIYVYGGKTMLDFVNPPLPLVRMNLRIGVLVTIFTLPAKLTTYIPAMPDYLVWTVTWAVYPALTTLIYAFMVRKPTRE